MNLIPVYINRRAFLCEQHDTARVTIKWLGLSTAKILSKLPPGPKHSFNSMQGHAHYLGLIMAPSGSRLSSGPGSQVLLVPTSQGLIRLSAADVCEQASVGGCGLKWVTGIPEKWRKVAS